MKYEEKFTPEAAASIMNSCILFSDVIVAGKDSAVALKFDEENMFTPMIVFLEKDAPAGALVWAAETLEVPVVKNISLAKNLVSYGKAGESIPEICYRDVSLVFARLGSQGHPRPAPAFKKKRGESPAKLSRPLSLELGASLYALTGEEPGREKLLAEPLNLIRKKLIRLLGFPIPHFRISRASRLGNDEYRILFRGLEASRGRLELGWYIGALGAPSQAEFPIPHASFPYIMNTPGNVSAAAKAASSMLVRYVDEIVQRRAPELLGRDEVAAILDAAEEKYPVVTGEVKSLLPLGIVREILQGLVSERVSIRHISVILETLADWGSFGAAPSGMIIEKIRQSLKRQICLEYADEKLRLRVLTLDPKLEKGFTEDPPGSVSESALPAGTEMEAEDWENVVSSAVKGMEEKGFPPVILCSPRVRFSVKEATRRKLPDLAVLSFMEIPPDISVEPVGEIRLEKRGPKFLPRKI